VTINNIYYFKTVHTVLSKISDTYRVRDGALTTNTAVLQRMALPICDETSSGPKSIERFCKVNFTSPETKVIYIYDI
jgi:hypothetical protein